MVDALVKLLTGLAWPAVVLIVIWVLREPIKTMIGNRAFKLSPQGLEVTIPTQTLRDAQVTKLEQALAPAEPVGKEHAPSATSRPVADYFAPPFQDFVVEIEKRVDQELPAHVTHLGKSKEEALKHVLVENLGALYLERASRHLLGSQVDTLTFLARNNDKATTENLRPFYAAAASALPVFYANYTFEQWLAFMISWNLIKVEGTDVTLSPAGRAVIPYMRNWGYLATRPVG